MRREQRSEQAQNYHRWYKLAIWQQIRNQQLTKRPLCEFHLNQKQEVLATYCDHITPHRGDWLAFVQGPFQSLCPSCHNSIKQSQERSGYDKSVDTSGAPTDPNHHWNN